MGPPPGQKTHPWSLVPLRRAHPGPGPHLAPGPGPHLAPAGTPLRSCPRAWLSLSPGSASHTQSPGANLLSISHRYCLREVAFEWELTQETIYLPLRCLQGEVRYTAPILVTGRYTAPILAGFSHSRSHPPAGTRRRSWQRAWRQARSSPSSPSSRPSGLSSLTRYRGTSLIRKRKSLLSLKSSCRS